MHIRKSIFYHASESYVTAAVVQGQGFDEDFDKLQKSIGPGKISLGDFMRDVEAINRVYVPIVQRSYKWMRYGSMRCVNVMYDVQRAALIPCQQISQTDATTPTRLCLTRCGCSMLGALVLFIIMGIIGGTPEIRSIIILLSLLAFLGGLGSFLYSKWIEQGIIKDGARAVKMVIDEELNPKYLDNPHRLKYTVSAQTQPAWLFLNSTLLALQTAMRVLNSLSACLPASLCILLAE